MKTKLFLAAFLFFTVGILQVNAQAERPTMTKPQPKQGKTMTRKHKNSAPEKQEYTREQQLQAVLVARSCVDAIIYYQYDKAFSLFTTQYRNAIKQWAAEKGIKPEEFFDPEYTHDITEMRPLLENGYRPKITSIENIADGVSVRFNCFSSDGKAYDGDIFDSTARLVMTIENGEWRVAYIK